ncbi:MAG: hypothetical protein QM662_13810 [Gordonia sp. (in: high G+C Gram-positive bacteria)]
MGKPVGALTYLVQFRDGWGALIPRWRRQYGSHLRDDLRELAWQDVAAMVHDLGPSWTRTDENHALLVDLTNYWLEAEYVKWTTSPGEAKRAAARRPRKQPPPFPIVRPVAHRPPAVHAAAMRRYEALCARYDATARPESTDPATFLQAMTAALGGTHVVTQP